jgi:hypothetical protein
VRPKWPDPRDQRPGGQSTSDNCRNSHPGWTNFLASQGNSDNSRNSHPGWHNSQGSQKTSYRAKIGVDVVVVVVVVYFLPSVYISDRQSCTISDEESTIKEKRGSIGRMSRQK